jgi:vancomycin resistance protein YoaR
MIQKDNKTFGVSVAYGVVFLLLVFFSWYFFNSNKLQSNNVSKKVPVQEEVFEKVEEQELLGRAELSFAGGTEGRGKNIELGIDRISGTVVAPNEEFSFGKALGSVSLEDGFSEERVFLNGEVIKGVGGGLCQVSTTLFQSLIRSGLPITERHNHTYTVVLYDTGLDATYAENGPDLKFINDTGSPITIKGKVENQKAVFEIYGKKDGRVASTTEPEIKNIVDILPTKYVFVTEREEGEPECINTPQIGYTSEVKYSIFYPDGRNHEQVFTSKYNPLQRVCFLVGNEGLKKYNASTLSKSTL